MGHRFQRERGAKASKTREIAAILRREIVEGRLPPGGRVPTRAELEKRFSSSRATIQAALDRLTVDGFVHALGRNGTVVREELPFLKRIAVVFPFQPSTPDWTLFWQAISVAVNTVSRETGVTPLMHYGLEHPSNQSAYQGLVRELDAQRIAGLFFASTPGNFAGTPVLEKPGIPRVAWMAPGHVPGVAALDFDGRPYAEKALGYLAARGRRRVAFLMWERCEESYLENCGLSDGLRRHALETRPEWILGGSLRSPHLTRNTIRLLMCRETTSRPDALVILDDNLVAPAAEGLRAAGVRVPEELEVLAHSNFPVVPETTVPVMRLGYDVPEMVRQAFGYILAARQGKNPSMSMAFSPVFEHELPVRAPDAVGRAKTR